MPDHEQTLGRYRLLTLIGAGGMGKVYRAHDDALERDVAIKILPPEVITDASRVQRFIQEARAASALNHPHVVAIYDIGDQHVDGQQQPLHYIAMELIDGKTLRELTTSGPLDIRKAIKIVLQVAEALTAAHAAGIIHRDLKPENIMVTTGGYAKVLDFGLAKLRVPDDHGDGGTVSRTIARETEPGVVLGTAGYLSPEQALGKAIDSRTDIFSLGCVLYELATGRRAFQGDSSVDTLHKVIYNEPEPIRAVRPDVPAELVRIVRKALAKDPDERYQTVKDLAIDLRELLRDLDSNPSGQSLSVPSVPTAALPPSAALQAAGERPRSRRIIISALIALAIVTAIGFAIFRLRPQPVARQSAAAMRVTRVTASGKVIAAAISTDGKFVCYTVSDQGEQSLWVRQMPSGQSLQLIPPKRDAYWGVAFAPDGSIYYGQKSAVAPSGAIYQISTLGGTPRKIISEIDSQPTFSPDGKRMAFLRARFPTESESALMVANIDGSGAKALATVRSPEFLVPVFFAGASWSPDGKLIATSINNRSPLEARMVAVDIESGRMETIAKADWRQAAQVAWLPDQKGLVGIAQRTNDTRSQVWYVSYPDGQALPVTNDLFDYRAVSVTGDGKSVMTVAADVAADVWIVPDGAPPKRTTAAKLEGAFGTEQLADGRIIFTSLETGKMDIWIMNADGSGRTLLTRDPHENRSPVVTPDGKLIVYVSVTSKQTELCRMNLDGSDRRVLGITVQAADPDVSPDGKQVVYETVDTSSPSRKNTLILARVPIEGGTPVFLTDYLSLLPVYSPDGSRMAMYVQEGPEAPFYLAILAAQGGKPQKRIEVSAPFFRSNIRWTPDGSALIVNTAPSDRANLWQVPLDGSTPRKLTQFDEHTLMSFAPLRVGRGWVLSRGDMSRDAVLITDFR